MPNFADLPTGERRALIEEAGSKLDVPPEIIEKDYWVTWTLGELFTMRGWGEHFAFKGGTSLSKCWGIIDRFSEDIDIVVDRAFLGFSGGSLTGNRIEKLRKCCSDRVLAEVMPCLLESTGKLASLGHWACEPKFGEGKDRVLEALNLLYPSCLTGGPGDPTSYMKRMVRIEFGARSETWPSRQVRVMTMLEEALQEVVETPSATVQAIAPERTFLDKLMILHEEHHRPGDSREPKRHMARHFYDVHRLIIAGVAERAAHDPGLFNSALTHRRRFFRGMARHVEENPALEVSRGTLAAVPKDAQGEHWRRDYESMRDFFRGEPPGWEEIVADIERWQVEFNSTPWPKDYP